MAVFPRRGSPPPQGLAPCGKKELFSLSLLWSSSGTMVPPFSPWCRLWARPAGWVGDLPTPAVPCLLVLHHGGGSSGPSIPGRPHSGSARRRSEGFCLGAVTRTPPDKPHPRISVGRFCLGLNMIRLLCPFACSPSPPQGRADLQAHKSVERAQGEPVPRESPPPTSDPKERKWGSPDRAASVRAGL